MSLRNGQQQEEGHNVIQVLSAFHGIGIRQPLAEILTVEVLTCACEGCMATPDGLAS